MFPVREARLHFDSVWEEELRRAGAGGYLWILPQMSFGKFCKSLQVFCNVINFWMPWYLIKGMSFKSTSFSLLSQDSTIIQITIMFKDEWMQWGPWLCCWESEDVFSLSQKSRSFYFRLLWLYSAGGKVLRDPCILPSQLLQNHLHGKGTDVSLKYGNCQQSQP